MKGRLFEGEGSGELSPLRVALFLAASIFLVEAAVMLLLSAVPPLSPVGEALADSTLLLLLLFPVLYLVLVRPLTGVVDDLRGQKEELGRYEDLVNHVPVGVYRNTPGEDGSFIEVNPAMVEIFEADSEEQLLGLNVSDLYVDPSDREQFSRKLERDGVVRGEELRLETLEGREIWGSVTAIKTRDEEGEVFFEGTIEETTERKRAEQSLKRSEEKYHSITEDVLDTSNIGLIVLDECFDVVWVNQSVEEFLGLEREEVLGRDKRNLLEEVSERFEEPEQFVDRVEASYDANDYTEDFVLHVPEDCHGEERWLKHWSTPIETGLYAGGRIEHYEDITERKEAERALRESEEKYSTVFESSNDGIIVIQDGVFKLANQSFAEMVGTGVDDLEGSDFVEYVAPEYRAKVKERYEQRLAGEDPPARYEIEACSESGERIPVEINPSIISYEGRPADLAIIRDVSDRVKRERILEALNEASREMIRAESKGEVLQLSVDTMKEVIDLSLTTAWLYDGEEALEPVACTDDVEEVFDGLPTYTSDGESLSWEAFEEGEVRIYDDVTEEEGRHNDDTPVRSEMVLPLNGYGVINVGSEEPGRFDELDERFARLLAANTAVALDKVDREEKLEESRSRLRGKNEELEVLNRLVRHDIRNDMNLVIGWTDYLLSRDSDPPRELENIMETSRHVIGLTRAARDFVDSVSEAGSRDLKPVELKPQLQSELMKAEERYPDASFDQTGLPEAHVEADDMLPSIFRNLLNNAVQHNDKERPEIEVDAEERNGEVVVSVADNGPGVPDGLKEEIFGKGEKGLESPGTGIGLYLVHTLAEGYGGKAWVEDNEPEGAVFKVRLQKPADAGRDVVPEAVGER